MYLVQGDPMAPRSDDLIAQTAFVKKESAIPLGWGLLEHRNYSCVIGRLVTRGMLEQEK